MTVYIDSDYRCHTAAAGGLRAIDVQFPEGKCPRFIEGYRFVPPGETWCRADGRSFTGPMLAPAKNYTVLSAAQELYEELSPELSELKEKLQRMQDCVDGLSTIPTLEQLKDFLLAIREVLEDDFSV